MKSVRHLERPNLLSIWKMLDKIYFLGYVILAQRAKIEDKEIWAVKNWHNKSSRIIAALLITNNLLENLLMSVDMAQEDELGGGSGAIKKFA